MADSPHVLRMDAGPVGTVAVPAIAQKGLRVTVLETDAVYDEKPRAARFADGVEQEPPGRTRPRGPQGAAR